MLFDMRRTQRRRSNPAKKSIFRKVEEALERGGVGTGPIRHIGQWRAVWGKDSNNTAAVIGVYRDFVQVDLLLVYWPDSKILSASFWRPGKGGGSEFDRIDPGYSYTNDANARTIGEIVKDVRELLDEYDESYQEWEFGQE